MNYKKDKEGNAIVEVKINKFAIDILEEHLDKRLLDTLLVWWADEAVQTIHTRALNYHHNQLDANKKEEKSNDIKQMLLVIASHTEEGTEGAKLLDEWSKKYD